MNKDCFEDLIKMTEVTQSVCAYISGGVYFDCKCELKESERLKKHCIETAVKQFITPVDREDIAYLALKLHKFSVQLCRLAEYKKNFFPKKDVKKTVEPLVNICKNIRAAVENDLSRAEYSESYTLFFWEEQLPENRYSPLGVISEYVLYELIGVCFDTAADIYDYIIRTTIKNT